MKTTILSFILLLACFALQAQDRLGIELRAGGDYATQQLDDADLGFGFGFEGIISYRFIPHLSAYAGWGWQRFTTDELLVDEKTDVEETGYRMGLQFMHPFGASSLAYYLRAGAIYNHLELEDEAGNITSDSGHGFGWQAQAGVAIPLGKGWNILPGVGYSSLQRDIGIGDYRTKAHLNYVAVSVGINKTF